MNIESAEQLGSLDFESAGGVMPMVVQNGTTGEVLKVSYANREALERSLETGDLWLFSRKRNRVRRKGESSGNIQRVLSISLDCDGDAVLVRVDPRGPACHTGARSCFNDPPTLVALGDVIARRAVELSENSYTVRLLTDANLRLKKLGEEAVELALACNQGDKDKSVDEAADLMYHMLVACKAVGASIDDILQRVDARRK
ncbi:MAG: bifunctional phosphoribosyl-AMP cyclohydrolase/phosphoribosyl-ATP diphosphatase HisIE [Gemmatimonadota bacterium]